MHSFKESMNRYRKEKHRKYTKALNTPLDALLQDFKTKFEQEPLIKNNDVFEWTRINFDNAHEINKDAAILAIKAALFKGDREKIFDFVLSTLQPPKLVHSFNFSANRVELHPDKLKKQGLYLFNFFKNEVEKNGVHIKNLIYSNFLLNYISAFPSSAAILEEISSNLEPGPIKDDFIKNSTLLTRPEFIKENFFPLLKYYSLDPAASIYFLITLQDDNSFPILEESYNELIKYGCDFTKLIYCWSDSSHMPLNRFLLYNAHPPSIDFFISKGLPLSVFVKPGQCVKIKYSKEDVIKYTFKNIKQDMDWGDEERQELKVLLEKQQFVNLVPKVNTNNKDKNNLKI